MPRPGLYSLLRTLAMIGVSLPLVLLVMGAAAAASHPPRRAAMQMSAPASAKPAAPRSTSLPPPAVTPPLPVARTVQPVTLLLVSSAAAAAQVQADFAQAAPLLAGSGASEPQTAYLVLPRNMATPSLTAATAAIELVDLRYLTP